MTKYILDFHLATSDKKIYTTFMEAIEESVFDYETEEIDFELSQQTREEDEEKG